MATLDPRLLTRLLSELYPRPRPQPKPVPPGPQYLDFPRRKPRGDVDVSYRFIQNGASRIRGEFLRPHTATRAPAVGDLLTVELPQEHVYVDRKLVPTEPATVQYRLTALQPRGLDSYGFEATISPRTVEQHYMDHVRLGLIKP